MNLPDREPHRRPFIARRIILYLVVFSSFVTLLTTTTQLYIDYRKDVNHLDAELDQLEASYLQPLILDLWVLDDERVITLLEGMLVLPDIERLEVWQQGQLLYAVGDKRTELVRLREYPLIYRKDGDVNDLGVLRAAANLAQVHQRLFDRLWVILIGNALKTFAVVLFAYVLLRRLLTRHLEHIAAFLGALDPLGRGTDLQLDRHTRADDESAGGVERDELDVVVDSVNAMRQRLQGTYAALAESESRLRAVFENSPNCIALRGNDNRYLLQSPHCQSVLQALAAEGGSEPAGRDPARPTVREFSVGEGERRRIYLANEFPIIAMDGSVEGSGLIATDISERKRLEEQLQRHRQHLEELVAERTADVRRQATILDQIHDAVIATDLRGNVNGWNKGAERQFGYAAEEALGRHVSFLYTEGDRATLRERFINPLKARGEHEVEVQTLRKDGESIDLLLSMSMLHDEAGAPIGMIGYSIDITHRKLAEAQLRQRTQELETANRELQSFSYSVSHDLRGPLRSIDGFCALLAEDYAERLDSTGRDYIVRVRNATHRMGHLIDDLLRLSRVSRTPLHRTRFDMSMTVKAIVDNLREADPQRTVRTLVMPDVEADADPGLVRIALENLLSNAWKFTRHTDDPFIEFSVHRDDGSTVYCVSDNGVGFDMQHAAKLFGPFERLHSDYDFEGSGIGLAAVARIVARHHGRIWAEAAPGKGACFCFTLEAHQTRELVA